MKHFKARSVAELLGVFVVLFIAPFARGGDHFLTIGGGDSPANNQVSLEKNVLFFQRLLGEIEGKDTPQDVLFADGSGKTRDLQVLAPDDPPRINLLLARLFAGENELAFQFRQHDIPGVHGSSTRRGLEEWFNTKGTKLGEDDRLFIYFTGHGGAGKPEENTTISMWC
ncbi:MAG: signal peptide protein, partial [Phycisphaerales bacterium]|nr:signal peptide protein [Phycisphaerales bacterium]